MSPRIILFCFLLQFYLSLFSQIPVPFAVDNTYNGDILYRKTVPFVPDGGTGKDIVWHLPRVIDKGQDCLVATIFSKDSVSVYAEGRVHEYHVHGDTLYYKGEQCPDAFTIFSAERPYLKSSVQFGDSVSGKYRGVSKDVADYYLVDGSGFSAQDGMGSLTDGKDTLFHVSRIHFHEESLLNNFATSKTLRKVEDQFVWYCEGNLYPIMESKMSCIYNNGMTVSEDSISYLYFPYMAMEVSANVPYDTIFSKIEIADAFREGIEQGQGTERLLSTAATLSSDGRTINVDYQLGLDSDITLRAYDIAGTLLGTTEYKNNTAGKGKGSIPLYRKPLGSVAILKVFCGAECFSQVVSPLPHKR